MAETTSLWAAGALGKRTGGNPKIAFAQVREDASVELASLRSLGEEQVVFCIGSGGCTAFSLLIARPQMLYVVDINRAQLFLIELKRSAIKRLPYPDLLACMKGDARPLYSELRSSLGADAAEFWDERRNLLRDGLSQCGEIEHQLKRAMKLFQFLIHPRSRVQQALVQSDTREQRRLYDAQWNSLRWRLALAIGLSKPVLRLIYGRQFINVLPGGFAGFINKAVACALVSSPTRDNGYLWQTFLGCYPMAESGLPLYLQRENHRQIVNQLARVETAHADAAEWLARRPARSVGFFALSNILEGTSRDYAAKLVAAVTHAARPGGLVCLRWILPPSREVIELLQAEWQAERELTQKVSRLDRSLFCKFIHVYRV